jgi:DNA replication regulator SLD2
MDDQQKAEFESQSQILRVELKTWENEWAKNHGGNKPARENIKQNPGIGKNPFTRRLLDVS